MAEKNQLYTLIPLEDFKDFLGFDDREDKLSRFCLVTATLSIEQYCKRRLLRKNVFETVEFNGSLFHPLREYPVTQILAVYINGEILETEFYSAVPDCGLDWDIPFSISFSPALLRYRGLYKSPIAVFSNNDRIVITLNTECKALGFKRETFFLNKHRLEIYGVVIFSSNYTLYADMSARMNLIYNRFAPDVEAYSIDESFLFSLNGTIQISWQWEGN